MTYRPAPPQVKKMRICNCNRIHSCIPECSHLCSWPQAMSSNATVSTKQSYMRKATNLKVRELRISMADTGALFENLRFFNSITAATDI